MSMGRPRKKGNKDLPVGLEPPYGAGNYRMRHPVHGFMFSLKTKDRALAKERYFAIMETLKGEIEKTELHSLLSINKNGSLSQYIIDYRDNYLPVALNNRGKQMNDGTKRIYRNYFTQINKEIGHYPVTDFNQDEGARIVRQYLSAWLLKPKSYNNIKAALSKLFDHIIDLGLITQNPCQAIKNKRTEKRDVYLTDEHYLLITNKMMLEHELYAKAIDWLYIMSGRPTNMLDIKEKQITDRGIEYQATKNDQFVIVEVDAELKELVSWFRNFKKEQGTVSPYLIVHPRNAKRGLARKPVTAERLYRVFKRACAVLELRYTLRDIRPKALTDEALLAGKATNKGAHITQAMRDHYVKIKPPVRITNNLKRIGK